jgi:hypothetical protein
MKVAISYLTADKIELVSQSLPPLLDGAMQGKYDLFVCDGSTTEANEKALWDLAYPTANIRSNVRGGAGAAIVYALTLMLKHEANYEVVGLVENDVLLRDGWLDCLDLFSKGAADGLGVGAVSARCFTDRVLFQRTDFAVMHNIGAGCILLTRQAAQIILDTFRTHWTSDNRRIFSQLCGIDIGAFWAFRMNEHFLTSDWGWDAVLAAHGLASLALNPSPVEMIGQNPPLAEQGLTLATGPVEERRDEKAFGWYRGELAKIREGHFQLGVSAKFHVDATTGTQTIFPHQMHMIGGVYSGDWRLKEVRGFGTFGWVARDNRAQLIVPVFGSCSILVSGGKTGGKVEVVDEGSGFTASPDMPPEGDNAQVLQLMVPAGIAYRKIRITALTPGICFYGVQTRERQPFLPNVSFDHSMLPPA